MGLRFPDLQPRDIAAGRAGAIRTRPETMWLGSVRGGMPPRSVVLPVKRYDLAQREPQAQNFLILSASTLERS